MFRWHLKFGYLLTVWGNLEGILGNLGEILHFESKSVGSKGLNICLISLFYTPDISLFLSLTSSQLNQVYNGRHSAGGPNSSINEWRLRKAAKRSMLCIYVRALKCLYISICVNPHHQMRHRLEIQKLKF